MYFRVSTAIAIAVTVTLGTLAFAAENKGAHASVYEMSEAEMMQKFMAVAAPGERHALIAESVGHWSTASEFGFGITAFVSRLGFTARIRSRCRSRTSGLTCMLLRSSSQDSPALRLQPMTMSSWGI